MPKLIKKSQAAMVFVTTVLLANMASAHEGHGSGSLFQHDLEHMAWNFSLIVLGLVLFGVYKYRSK